MKNLKLITASALFVSLMPALAHAILTPVSETITVYQVWVSLSASCTSPVKVIDNGTSGKAVNVVGAIDFGAGTLPANGSYNCLIVVLSDTQTIVSPATAGTGGSSNCTASLSITQDTCQTGTSSALPDGTTTTCTTGTNDKVAAYFSTSGTAGGESHNIATAKLLVAPIVVAGVSTSATFNVIDPDGLVNQNGGCGQDSNATLKITQP